MHEIGVVMEVVKKVELFAKKNGVTKIQTLVLQVGELSTVIPRYIEACYPAAVEGTMLQETELRIEVLPGNVICQKCNKVYRLLEHQKHCPHCNGREYEILCGREFMIKEIVAC